MYIEKLSEKSLPKENQKTRRKADLNTEMEDMRDEEGEDWEDAQYFNK